MERAGNDSKDWGRGWTSVGPALRGASPLGPPGHPRNGHGRDRQRCLSGGRRSHRPGPPPSPPPPPSPSAPPPERPPSPEGPPPPQRPGRLRPALVGQRAL